MQGLDTMEKTVSVYRFHFARSDAFDINILYCSLHSFDLLFHMVSSVRTILGVCDNHAFVRQNYSHSVYCGLLLMSPQSIQFFNFLFLILADVEHYSSYHTPATDR